MKKCFIFLVIFIFSSIIFAQATTVGEQEARKVEIASEVSSALQAEKMHSIIISGNVYTGLQADISKNSQIIYAWEDANTTPIWANLRFDYSFDGNSGATLNFRTKGTDTVSSTSSRFYPFLNRGFVWVKSPNGMFKVRSGYLWDSDFESNYNAWDTASNYEWVTEFTAFPIKGIEVGITLPTNYTKSDLFDSLKDITYGIVYTPSFGRISVMGEYGHNDANRSVNFGFDFTSIKNLLIRVEGDNQQIGISGKGYYQPYEEISYTIGSFIPDIAFMEYFYKDGTPTMIKIYPNLTYNVGKFSNFIGMFYNFNPIYMNNPYMQLEVNTQYNVNAKCHIKPGIYITHSTPDSDLVVSPYIEFFAAF